MIDNWGFFCVTSISIIDIPIRISLCSHQNSYKNSPILFKKYIASTLIMEHVPRNEMNSAMSMFCERVPPAYRPSFHLSKGSQTKRE